MFLKIELYDYYVKLFNKINLNYPDIDSIQFNYYLKEYLSFLNDDTSRILFDISKLIDGYFNKKNKKLIDFLNVPDKDKHFILSLFIYKSVVTSYKIVPPHDENFANSDKILDNIELLLQ